MLIYIALRDDKICTIAEIADSYSISKNHLMKVAQRLGQLDVLKTIRGKRGGLQLNKTPDSINLGELIQQLEPHFLIVECFDKEKGKCVISPVCRLKHILREAKNNFIETLEQYTLKDIVQDREPLSQILFSG
jgi:Rrf2 family nitric oxide-sensitive transcriptional repressor